MEMMVGMIMMPSTIAVVSSVVPLAAWNICWTIGTISCRPK